MYSITRRNGEAFNQHRWMSFIDGENLTIRAKEVAEQKGVELEPGAHYEPDIFLWMPGVVATESFGTRHRLSAPLRPHAVRAHYYTSAVGDEEKITSVTNHLWQIGFQPRVFKKKKGQNKAKGVDIALTTDMLSNAYHDNYEAAVLYAGDGDYVPLVEEVKRLGKVVYVTFFDAGLNHDLVLVSDSFLRLDEFFLDQWERYYREKEFRQHLDEAAEGIEPLDL